MGIELYEPSIRYSLLSNPRSGERLLRGLMGLKEAGPLEVYTRGGYLLRNPKAPRDLLEGVALTVGRWTARGSYDPSFMVRLLRHPNLGLTPEGILLGDEDRGVRTLAEAHPLLEIAEGVCG